MAAIVTPKLDRLISQFTAESDAQAKERTAQTEERELASNRNDKVLNRFDTVDNAIERTHEVEEVVESRYEAAQNHANAAANHAEMLRLNRESDKKAKADPNAFKSIYGQCKVISTDTLLKRKNHISQSTPLMVLVAGAIVLNAFLIGVEVS